MADALCGPSNALQQFSKHSSVDRTLQQDRLVGRGSPAQGFRSSPAGGATDAEFEAFQAGHTGQPLQLDFHHPPPPPLSQFASPPPPQFAQAHAQASQRPDWASDFQRLNISSAHTPPVQQQHRAPVPNAISSWHQDFMTQQAPVAQAPQFRQQNALGGLGGYGFQQGPAFGGINGGMNMNMSRVSEVAQGKQRAQEAAPVFDDAAFEQAFAQMDQHMEEEVKMKEVRPALSDHEVQPMLHTAQNQNAIETRVQEMAKEAENEDPMLQRLREQRPAVYAALKLRSAIDLGIEQDARIHFENLEVLENNNTLIQDASEARWVVDALQKITDHAAPEQSWIKTQAHTLTRAINERLMSTYPLLSTRTQMTSNMTNIWQDLEAAGYTRSPAPEQVLQQQPEQPQEARQEQQPPHDSDEMAETAGKLLERVADNTSEKFQKSNFLELMRRLRDREVRVEGDKMVEVSEKVSAFDSTPTFTSSSSSASTRQQNPQHFNQEQQALYLAGTNTNNSAATAIPEIDPTILNHADTDFTMPVFSSSDHRDEHFQESV
ncbi:hypothetical protein P280DRAFT_471810 [Massarina eburnea CBS 473.64]|uniref:Uncharacterized protein n=1 Tax=Massarina eburnea CBS 473.64 TaxID=1395130 RepID=A0A6A6RR94_9PLEO|nr:hypothetical protein P280DRAFT_471810 [Massarina eburnea CBS 473.64]